jgi:hypothetical protein
MSDPLQRQPPEAPAGTLWHSTTHLAGERAAASVGRRKVRILNHIAEHGPCTIFEVAAGMELNDHQISGRFGELEAAGLIVKTGQRRPKPETGCLAEVYRLGDTPAPPDLGTAAYPDTLTIGDDGAFERQAVMAGETIPGIPYARRSSGSVPRLLWRVQLVECEGCGKPVKLIQESGRKRYRCGTPDCNRTYELSIVSEPGQASLLALVMKTQ